jgi:hypothetical protein
VRHVGAVLRRQKIHTNQNAFQIARSFQRLCAGIEVLNHSLGFDLALLLHAQTKVHWVLMGRHAREREFESLKIQNLDRHSEFQTRSPDDAQCFGGFLAT